MESLAELNQGGRIVNYSAGGGLRQILARHEDDALNVEVADRGVVLDMDTPEDYRNLLQRAASIDLPDRSECETVLRLAGTPPGVIVHSRAVAALACGLASLASENKVLGHPASLDSIPTSGNQEDHVSMGSIAAKKAETVIDNVFWIIAGEMLAAAQALDFAKHTTGKGARLARNLVREVIPHWDDDRILYKDLYRVRDLLLTGMVNRKVEMEVRLLV